MQLVKASYEESFEDHPGVILTRSRPTPVSSNEVVIFYNMGGTAVVLIVPEQCEGCSGIFCFVMSQRRRLLKAPATAYNFGTCRKTFPVI